MADPNFYENPYAASLVDDHSPPIASAEQEEYERIRQHHIKHEASIKAIGALYYLGSIILGLVGIALLFGLLAGEQFGNAPSWIVILALTFCVFQFFVGRGLRSFQPWARYAAAGSSLLGLLDLPIGTLVSIYILYLLLSKKGQTIFSEPYKSVIAATPHVRYRTSWIVWAALIVLVVVLIASVFAAITL